VTTVPRRPDATSDDWLSSQAGQRHATTTRRKTTTGRTSHMTEHMSGDPDADDRFVRLDDGDMHVVQDGTPGAPALLLIHGSAGSLASWDAVVPSLAGAFRVIRVDLLG
jgi:hypothetical protein